MSKNKLSKGQQRRVNANHQRRLKTRPEKAEPDDSLFSEPEEGIVISRFGMHADVEDSTGIFCGVISAGLSVHWSPVTVWSGAHHKVVPGKDCRSRS